MFTIIKGLWNARNLSGDPRLHVIEKYQGDDKKMILALPFAWEPASWYYALLKFSKSHNKAIAHLRLTSPSRLFWFGIIIASCGLAVLSYMLLIDWSELAAIILSCFIFMGLSF